MRPFGISAWFVAAGALALAASASLYSPPAEGG
jgi:hypothetical protein